MKNKCEMPVPGTQYLKLGQISGVHPLVEAIRTEAGCQLASQPCGVFSGAGLLEIARRFPLRVVRHKGEYCCVGGLQVYRLLQLCMSAETDIPVVIHARLSRKALADFIRIELFVIPAFFALRNNDVARLGAIWAQLANTELFIRIFADPGARALASLLDRDIRTVVKWLQQSGSSVPRSEDAGSSVVGENESSTAPETDTTVANSNLSGGANAQAGEPQDGTQV